MKDAARNTFVCYAACLCLLAVAALSGEMKRRPGPIEVHVATMERCQPCSQLRPILAGLRREGWSVEEWDVAQWPDFYRDWECVGCPTLLIIQDGRLLARKVGLQDAAALRRWFETLHVRRTTPKAEIE